MKRKHLVHFSFPLIDVVLLVCAGKCALSEPVSVAAHPCMHVQQCLSMFGNNPPQGLSIPIGSDGGAGARRRR